MNKRIFFSVLVPVAVWAAVPRGQEIAQTVKHRNVEVENKLVVRNEAQINGATLGGLTTITGTAQFEQDISVQRKAHIAEAQVTGTAFFEGDVQIAGNLVAGKTSIVATSTVIESPLCIQHGADGEGAIIFRKPGLREKARIAVHSGDSTGLSLYFDGARSAQVTVDGQGNIGCRDIASSGALRVKQHISAKALKVWNDIHGGGALSIERDATVGGNMVVDGTLHVEGRLSTENAVSIGDDLRVAKNIVAGDVSVQDLAVQKISAQGDIEFQPREIKLHALGAMTLGAQLVALTVSTEKKSEFTAHGVHVSVVSDDDRDYSRHIVLSFDPVFSATPVVVVTLDESSGKAYYAAVRHVTAHSCEIVAYNFLSIPHRIFTVNIMIFGAR